MQDEIFVQYPDGEIEGTYNAVMCIRNIDILHTQLNRSCLERKFTNRYTYLDKL